MMAVVDFLNYHMSEVNFELIGDPTYGEIWNLQTWYDWGGGIKHIGGDLCLTKIQLQSEWFGRISRVGIYRR